MLDFNHVLQVEGKGALRLSFSSISTPKNRKLHVTVVTPADESYHFNMEENHGAWKMITAPKPPDWIGQLEPLVQQLVQKHMRHVNAGQFVKAA